MFYANFMKIILTSSQLSHFHQNGEIAFEKFPIDFQKILEIQKKSSQFRDLWRREPFLKKIIAQTLSYIAFELTSKHQLRIACDQWLETALPDGYVQDFFCFQGLAIFFAIFLDEHNQCIVKAIHPSHLTSKIPTHSYIIAFANENARLINNPKDPFTIQTRNLGYVYGDLLIQEHHPLVLKK